MTRRRWIADEFTDNKAALTGEHAAHLARVLRARVGQEFEISSGDQVRLGTVTSVREDRVEFELGEEIHQIADLSLTLILSIFKFDRMEWAIEKTTELGVAKIVPAISRRSDAHLASAATKRLERWRRIAREAAQQARRVAPPEITVPLPLAQALEEVHAFRVVLAETERTTSLQKALESCPPDGEIALALGPEGGWTQDELAAFQQRGWRVASLGQNILRAETAAIAAVAVVMAHASATAHP